MVVQRLTAARLEPAALVAVVTAKTLLRRAMLAQPTPEAVVEAVALQVRRMAQVAQAAPVSSF